MSVADYNCVMSQEGSTYIIHLEVDPEFVKKLDNETAKQEIHNANEFTAYAVGSHALVDRVYGVLHYTGDEQVWYERSPEWILAKLHELGLVSAREKVTKEKVTGCLQKMVRNGRLRDVDRGEVFYRVNSY